MVGGNQDDLCEVFNLFSVWIQNKHLFASAIAKTSAKTNYAVRKCFNRHTFKSIAF